MYHGGIGLTNNRTGQTVIINFDASPSFIAAILPQIIIDPNTTEPTIVVSDTGAVFVYVQPGINISYWSGDVRSIGNMNATLYNHLMTTWLPTANATSGSSYDLFRVGPSWFNPDNISADHIYLPEEQCYAFVWRFLQKVVNCGVELTAMSSLRSWGTLYVTRAPTLITDDDKVGIARAATWWQALERRLASGALSIVEEIVALAVEGEMFVLYGGHVYSLMLGIPWAEAHWKEAMLPTPNGGAC